MASEMVLFWDWRGQPDWEAVQDALVRVYDGFNCPGLRAVPNTGRDDYAIVISSRSYSPAEAQQTWDDWDWESNEIGPRVPRSDRDGGDPHGD